MKKLSYNISKNEKERILEMHKNATSKFYLGEQMIGPVQNPPSNYVAQIDSTAVKQPVIPQNQESQTSQQTTVQAPKTYTDQYVKEIQKKLVSLGYDIGKTGIDGKFGPKTLDAIKFALDKLKNVPIDINQKTSSSIQSQTASPSQTQTASPSQTQPTPTTQPILKDNPYTDFQLQS